MGKISLTQRDVREALKDVVREEMLKEEAAKKSKRFAEAKKMNFGDNCPHCNALVSLKGKDGEWKEVGKYLYLVQPCPACNQDIWCRVVEHRSSDSIFAEAVLVGIFLRKEDVIKEKRPIATQNGNTNTEIPVKTYHNKEVINHNGVKIYDIKAYGDTLFFNDAGQ